MKLRTVLVVAALVAAASTTAVSAQAANMIVNGGFETGDLTGWTQIGNTSNAETTSLFKSSGSFSGEFGAFQTPGGVSQSFVTVPGGQYFIAFDLQNQGGTPSSVLVTFDGATLLTQTDPDPYGFMHFSYQVVAGSTTGTLAFQFQNDPSFFHLDDVVVDSVAIGSVPEPASWATMIVGLGMVGGLMRRRRRLALA